MKLIIEPDGFELEIPEGRTILECALEHGVPHTHACGGRARCSTCRILVLEGLDNCPPRNEKESALASRLGFADELRLACQTGPEGDLVVRRLVLDRTDVKMTSQLRKQNQQSLVGCEHHLAIVFADIRGFTSLSERLFPYDVIHLLDRYFDCMGRIIEERGGRVDNLIGDGLLALFSKGTPGDQARNAVEAGRRMLKSSREFASYVKTAYSIPSFRIGIGIHSGLAVIGSLGRGSTRRRTVIGDSVNTASRVENATKTSGTDLLISEAVHDLVKDEFPIGQTIQTDIRGKSGCFNLFEVKVDLDLD